MLRRKGDTDRTDPNAPVTMFEIARTGLVLDEAGGRFAQDTRVVGSSPNAGAVYPAAGVPNADVGEELPVGDDQRPEPTGTPTEVAASIERLERERGDV